MKKLVWIEEREQKVWLWVAAVFAVFYLSEAFLFRGPRPRVHAPAFTPLVYGGAFGAAVIFLLFRQPKAASRRPTPGVPRGLQSSILGVGITTAVVAFALVGVIRRRVCEAGQAAAWPTDSRYPFGPSHDSTSTNGGPPWL